MKEIWETIIIYSRENSVEIIKIVLTIIGVMVGLLQWKKSNDYKRADVTKMLITQIRDDKEIASVMDLLDWSKGIKYDGKFSCVDEEAKKLFEDDQQLFVAIDRTLAHFNYICYLKRLHIFKRKDITIFEYETKRLFDNQNIRNYLYSLFYWTAGLDVDCSFKYLIRYGLKKKWLTKDFLDNKSKNYKHWLRYQSVNKSKLLIHMYL